jgi:hypothetical protein
MDFLSRQFDGQAATTIAEVRVMPAQYAAAKGSAVPFFVGEYIAPFVTVTNSLRPYCYVPVAALVAARVFRDCSLRAQSSPLDRRACRTLMRQAAIKWRRGLAMGD